MNQTIDVEATPTNVPRDNQALMIRPAQEVGLFGTSEPIAVIEKATGVADALKQVIVKQGLVSKISGKEYPRCEAWTLLGTMLGVFPVTVWTKELENGWEARVEARTKDGAIVGAAEAECLRSEKNWQNRDDFALRSMAQTRATAKCLRMPLGFVMTLAGFEATPAEEMAYETSQTAPRTGSATQARQSGKVAPAKPQEAGSANKSTSPATRPAQPAVFADDDTRNRLISQLKDCSKLATEYFQKVGCLMDNEGLEDLPLRFVPVTRRQFQALQSALAGFGNGEEATGLPYPPNPEAEPDAPPAKPAKTKSGARQNDVQREGVRPSSSSAAAPTISPSVQAAKAKDPEWFWSVIISVPRKGMKKTEYDKHPDTIDSLYNAMKDGDKEAQSRLWGLVHHWDAVPREVNGKTYQPSEADKVCREALDAFAEHEERMSNQNQPESYPEQQDVPF